MADPSGKADPGSAKEELSESILDAAVEVCRRLGAKAVFLNADGLSDLEVAEELPADVNWFFTTRSEERKRALEQGGRCVLKVPGLDLSRVDQIKMGIVMALSEGLVERGDRLVCLSGLPGARRLDTLMVFDLEAELEMLRTAETPRVLEGVDPKTFEAVLSLALELAAEGREGRPTGGLFVVGDHEVVLQYSRPMVMNPFRGYPEGERNILDRSLWETIKEFASLDGAFVVRGDGVLEAAGRHLNAAYGGDDLPQGLGARHVAAAGITSVSAATAFAISESTGTVSVFKDGKIFMRIEKSRALEPRRKKK